MELALLWHIIVHTLYARDWFAAIPVNVILTHPGDDGFFLIFPDNALAEFTTPVASFPIIDPQQVQTLSKPNFAGNHEDYAPDNRNSNTCSS